MSCPFNKESLGKLEAFIDVCKQKPEILHLSELLFFKDYLESLGAKLPIVEPMESATENKTSPEPEVEAAEEPVAESDPESELEFDMEGCVEPDEVNADQEMGDPSKVPSDEEIEKADEDRTAAISEFTEGNFDKAVQLLSDAILLNPTSAVLFVKRGQSFLKLDKPNACIKDCTRALELNPDSAAGYKFRGRAHRLIADWENAAKDLREACRIDFDEQADEWLKEVTPNAQKIEQHRLKQERKKNDKIMEERFERLRKMKEANAKASQEESESGGGGSGMPGDGPAGMGDFYKFLQDPEMMSAFRDPEVAAAFEDISKNPANFMKYQGNPKVMDLVKKLSSKFQSSGMNFPGMGGFPPGGFPPGGFSGTDTSDTNPSSKFDDQFGLD